MATKKEFQTYMEQNKANLNKEALRWADMKNLYNEWRDTWSISKSYLNPASQIIQQEKAINTKPVQAPQQVPQPTQAPQVKPVTQVQQPTQPTPPTPKPTTITQPEIQAKPVVSWEAPTLEKPKYQSQIDNFLKTWSIAEARNKLKEGLNAWVIDKATYNKWDAYLIQQVNQKQQELVKSDEERMRMEEEKRKMQMDPNNLFNSIRTGQAVSQEIKNSAEYKRQQDRVNRLSKFENMSAPDLAYAMTNGQLFIWTETYNDLKQINPALVKQAEQLMSLNSALSTKKTSVEETRENIAKTILDKMTDTEITDFKWIISQNKEVVSLNNKLAETKNELDTLKESIDYMEDDLTKQLSWTWATRGYIQAKAARLNRDLIREYNAKLNEYNTTAGQLQTITENIKYELWLEDKRKAKELQALEFAYWIASDELGYQRGLEAEERQREQQLEARAYNEALQTRQLEQKYAYEYGDLNSVNPTLQNIAIERAVAWMYQNYPIPWMESQATKVQKVKNLMAQWMTWTEAIAQVESEIRNSQRYKDYLASQAPQTQAPIKMWEDSLYDPVTQTWITKPTATSWLWDLRSLASQFPWQAWAKNNNPAWITWNANFDAWTWTAALLREAWINFSKWTSRPASEWGNYVTFDTMEDWLAAQRIIMTKTYWNSTVEQMLGKWVWTWEALNYAKQVAWNAWINLKSKVSSLSDDQISQLQMAKIQKESPWLSSILQQAQTTWWQTTLQWYSQDKIELLAEISQIQSETEKRKALEGAWFTLQDLTKYKADASAWRIPPTEWQIQAALKTLSDIQGIAETDWTDATGKFDYSRLLWLQDATNAWVLIENLRDVASFNNLWMLKWPMSDKDIAFLKSVSSKLDPVQSNKQFEKNIVEMYNIAARKAGIKEIKKLSEIPKDRILPWQINTTWTSNQYKANNGKVYEIKINP